MFVRIIHETRGDQAVHGAEYQRGGGKDGDEIGDAAVRDEPYIDHGHLSGDVGEGGEYALAHRAEPAVWQVLRKRQYDEAA
jgi:hypothetical protein